MKETIVVRPAVLEDAAEIWKLIHELAVFEKAPDEFVITPEQLSENFSQGQFFAFVAESETGILGMALCYHIYSTWKGLSVYLEDLIVKDAYRRSGIGSLLFNRVVQYALENKAGKMIWQVLDWNTPAIEFYKKINANFDKEWLTCRLTREQIEAF